MVISISKEAENHENDRIKINFKVRKILWHQRKRCVETKCIKRALEIRLTMVVIAFSKYSL